MGDVQSAPINEIVSYLEKGSNARLNELKVRFPELVDELKTGIWAGSSKESADARKKERLLLARAAVALSALDKALDECTSAKEIAARRIRRLRQVRLAGSVVTIIGSSGVLGALGANQNLLAAVAGTCALLGSLASVISEHLEKIPGNPSKNIETIYLDFGKILSTAEIVSGNLRLYIEHKVDHDILEGAIGEANALCEQLNNGTYQVSI